MATLPSRTPSLIPSTSLRAAAGCDLPVVDHAIATLHPHMVVQAVATSFNSSSPSFAEAHHKLRRQLGDARHHSAGKAKCGGVGTMLSPRGGADGRSRRPGRPDALGRGFAGAAEPGDQM